MNPGVAFVEQFQTLIGTVKGLMAAHSSLCPKTFQTLIGTVKGRHGGGEMKKLVRFKPL